MIVTFRITPADAGKTGYSVIINSNVADHPRGCGENQEGKKREKSALGSPPRMRGKPSDSED